MTDNQVTELRVAAFIIQCNLDGHLYRRKDVDEMRKVSNLLLEAGDTIESLRDRLPKECAECAEGMGRYADALCDPLKQRIAELEEQRDVLLRCLENDYGIKASWDGLRKLWLTESVTTELDCIENKSRWYELFDTPERAARTLYDAESSTCIDCALRHYCGKLDFRNCAMSNYDALLKWMRK